MKPKAIAIDFDNVLHRMEKWTEGVADGLPMEGSLDKINLLNDRGYVCIVVTARKELGVVRDWLKLHHFPSMEVTNIKPPAIAYIDDRAIRFTNWEDIVKYFI